MAIIDSKQITTFLEAVGEQYPHKTKLILLGGGALCLLGSPRPTFDIDYAGSDLAKNDLQKLMDKIANIMDLEVEAVPINDSHHFPSEKKNEPFLWELLEVSRFSLLILT
jgi:hypothetical protein